MTGGGTPRIVSLLPAATEIVAALGFADDLVGRSHECDFPPGVEQLPVCTRALIEPKGTSREIDDAVKHALEHALSIYEVLSEPLAAAEPDVIITQDQCEVCAVALTDVEKAVNDLLDTDVRIVSLDPQNLAHIYDDVRRVAAALGAEANDEKVVSGLQARIAALETRFAATNRPSVACIEWADPLMAAGNWVPELVAIAGGRDPFGTAGAHAPWLEPERLFAEDPDVIVFMPCGFGLDRSETEARALLATDAWQALSATKNGRIYATDGNSYFNRPGPRLVDSAEILAEIVHPEHTPPTHAGTAWKQVG